MIITRFLAVVGAGALGITALAGAALAVLVVAQRVKRWWCSRGEMADVPDGPELSRDDLRDAVDIAVNNPEKTAALWRELTKAPELRDLKRLPRRVAKEGAPSRRIYRWTRDLLGGRR